MKKPASKNIITKKKNTNLQTRLEKLPTQQKKCLRNFSSKDLNKMIQELGTHQLELEKQNTRLRRTHVELGTSRGKYEDLYNFSPVGYFTFNKKSLIKEVNSTNTRMFGSTKRLLLLMLLSRLVRNPCYGVLY